MTGDLGYGKRLSGEEYDKQVIQLHRYASPIPSKEEDTKIRRQELSLSIDYRLGVDYPQQKREVLWEIQQRVEKRRLWLGIKYGLRLLLCKNTIPQQLPKQANTLAGFMVNEFSSVLNEKELLSFFELEPGEKATLPVDFDELSKK